MCTRTTSKGFSRPELRLGRPKDKRKPVDGDERFTPGILRDEEALSQRNNRWKRSPLK